MAFKFAILCAVLAYANAGFLSAPALSYAAAPALAYGAAAPTLGSTFYGRSYAAAPVAYAAAAPTIGSTFYGRSYAAPVAYAAPAVAPAITSQHSNIIRSFGNLGQVSTYSKTINTPFSSVRKADIRVSNPGIRTIAAPALSYAAPAISTYGAGIGYSAGLGYGAGLGYAAAPAISAYGAGIGYSAGLGYGAGLGYTAAPAISAYGAGIGYSAAPAVSHLNYASAYANYGW